MTYLRYTHTRSRSRSRERSPLPPLHNPYETHTTSPRPLVRHSSKHHLSEDSDDGYDDYPYAANHKPSKPSRALAIRPQPSQLERYNIWSDHRVKHSEDPPRNQARHASLRLHRRHDHATKHAEDTYNEEDERAFRLKVHATLSRARTPSPPRHVHAWPGALFRRHEKFVDEAFETRERTRSPPRRKVSFWDEEKVVAVKREEEEEEDEDEKWMKYRRVKRTRTEEWRPLSGWRRG